METSIERERLRFVKAHESGHWAMSELCERYGISRPTGYKWAARYREGGEDSVRDRSRAPHRSPYRTSREIEERILEVRREFGWGAKKVLAILRRREPEEAWPARSTVNDILDRHGVLRKRSRRRRWAHPGVVALQTERPNQVWPADFKGQFRMGNGQYCYPLTVTDHFSRALLTCQAQSSVSMEETQNGFRALFREVGLPEAIRTDNGTPFASIGVHGLTRLSVWWMKLGIIHQRIHVSSPQENATHERMHRELKRETARPAAASLKRQQRRFDSFRRSYNEERPHEGIGDQLPASHWKPSERPYPEQLPEPQYAAHMEVRLVSDIGTFSFRTRIRFLSNALAGERIGMEEVDDGIWNIVYFRTLLGRLDERNKTITGV